MRLRSRTSGKGSDQPFCCLQSRDQAVLQGLHGPRPHLVTLFSNACKATPAHSPRKNPRSQRMPNAVQTQTLNTHSNTIVPISRSNHPRKTLLQVDGHLVERRYHGRPVQVRCQLQSKCRRDHKRGKTKTHTLDFSRRPLFPAESQKGYFRF